MGVHCRNSSGTLCHDYPNGQQNLMTTLSKIVREVKADANFKFGLKEGNKAVRNKFTLMIVRRRNSRLRIHELQLIFSYLLRFGVLILAAVALISGVVMVFHGLQGSVDVGLHATDIFQAHLINASPGVVFAVIGVILCCAILSQGPPPADALVRVRSANPSHLRFRRNLMPS